MLKLDLYTWKFLRIPVIVFGILLTVVSSFLYIGFITWDKSTQLESRLSVAADTVSTSLKARDWDLALEHLRSISTASNTYDIEMFQTPTTTIVGPLGIAPFGLGSICKTITASQNLSLRGCTRLIGRNEIVTVGILVLSQIVFLLAALFFLWLRTKLFMGKISSELEALQNLQVSSSDLEKLSAGFSELSELKEIRKRILSLIRHVEQSSADAAFAQMASQVAHDIRSPLAALNLAVASIADIPEDRRLLIREAVSKIRDIANQLVKKEQSHCAGKVGMAPSVNMSGEPSVELLSALIEPLITEKRIQYAERHQIEIDAILEQCAYGLFSKVDSLEFKRVLSNLVDNAVEAIESKGRVTVRLKRDLEKLTVIVEDSGKGIPKAILPKLTRKGATFGKPNGTGLGLFHAKNMIRSWDGTIEIQSEQNAGTTVYITLPKATPPSWFVPSIHISPQMEILVLDDDKSIHCVWNDRLRDLPVKIKHFYTANALRDWVKYQSDGKAALFLVDYEILGQKETGLDLIEELGIGERSILVSSRYDARDIRNKCAKLNVQLIPKGSAGFVPIVIPN